MGKRDRSQILRKSDFAVAEKFSDSMGDLLPSGDVSCLWVLNTPFSGMSQRESDFYRAIAAQPDDPGRRLEFARWLEEKEDHRAEFIREDLRRTERSEDASAFEEEEGLDQRERWIEAHGAKWLAELAGLASFPGVTYADADRGPRFDRGFPCQAVTTWHALRACGDELFRTLPITHVVIRTPTTGEDDADSEGIFDCPWFRRIRALEIHSHSRHTNELVTQLARSENAAGLRSLAIHCWTGLDHTGGVKALAESDRLANLERLELSGHDLGNEAAELVAGSQHLTRLLTYRSQGIQLPAASVVDHRGAKAFGSASVIRLHELCLPSHSLESDGAAALAAGAALSGLRVLDVSGNRIGRAGVQALADSKVLTGLSELRVGDNRLGPGGVEILVQSPVVRRLRRLDLAGEDLSDDMALALRRSSQLPDSCEIRL